MNICIITSSYPLNPKDAEAAAGVVVRDFALELASQKHNIFIMTQLREGVIEDDPELTVIRFPWRGKNKRLSTLNLSNFNDILNIISVIYEGKKALFKLIRNKNIDLIIAMWAVPCGGWAYLARKKFKIPYITWTLGSDIWIYGRKKITRGIVSNILKNSIKLYSDGEDLRKETERIAGKKCEFLATTRILPKNHLPTIDIDKSKQNFLYIGRYHPHKGVDLLIEAIKLISSAELENMYFYIFGGGELDSLIRDKVLQYGLTKNVAINGYITPEYAAAYLKEVKALIIPSRIESIPVVFSDALQMGCPIIATNVGDMGNLMESASVGRIAEPNSESIKDAIIAMGRTDRNSYQDNINKLYTIFDLKNSTEKIIGGNIIRQ